VPLLLLFAVLLACMSVCVVSLQLTRSDYEAVWPTLPPKIRELVRNVTYGRGFQIIK